MAARKKTTKKAATAVKVADPHAAIKPTPAALKDTLSAIEGIVKTLEAPAEPAVGDLVYAMMHYFFADGLADGYGQEVVHRLEEGCVDRNEFRVTEAFEVAEQLEDLQIPDLFDRCMAVREAVSQVYNDQNGVSLDLLREATISERNQFFQRVPALTPGATHYIVTLLSFEECIFSPRSTVRVQTRLGLDPKSSAVQKFFADLKELLDPWGHIPMVIGPQAKNGKVVMTPELTPASLLVRLGPPAKGKKK